jgi:EamA domain-containing membrane protein RarD
MANDKISAVIISTIISIFTSLFLAIFNLPDPIETAINSLAKSLNIISNIAQNALPTNAPPQAHAIISNANSSSMIALNFFGFFVLIEPILTVVLLVLVWANGRNNEYN